MKRAREYHSAQPMRRPGPSGSSPKTCRPRPETETSTNAPGTAASTAAAQPATSPSGPMQPSRSRQANPAPSMNPHGPPATCSRVVQVAGSVADAGAPETITGRLPMQAVQRSAASISAGSRPRRRTR